VGGRLGVVVVVFCRKFVIPIVYDYAGVVPERELVLRANFWPPHTVCGGDSPRWACSLRATVRARLTAGRSIVYSFGPPRDQPLVSPSETWKRSKRGPKEPST